MKTEGSAIRSPSSGFGRTRSGDEPCVSMNNSAKAFTLIELLTVIAIIGVLASLLLTALTSAKKKSRTTVCTFNLRQISLALDMYLDESGQRPGVGDLVGKRYLPAARSLLCPEDKTGNWGGLVQQGGSPVFVGVPLDSVTTNMAEPVKYSYLLHPLYWEESMWKRLMRLGGSAGVSACQLHGLGTQDVPDVRRFSGLLLRGQRDGAVVRRQIFWSGLNADLGYGGGGLLPVGPSGFGPNDFSRGPEALQSLPIYLDDPVGWLQNNP
jgi:prepilin-type N-terminal cleavage/methylation domain-containing protein